MHNIFPKISVVTVTYNVENSIETTLLSVLNQDYPNLEFIVIDGGSTDKTTEIIRKYSNKITYWISEPDNGIYDAMNKGIVKACGKWINFMNAGDVFHSSTVLTEIFSKSIPLNKKVIYGDHCIVYEKKCYHVPSSQISIIKHKMPFCHQATFTLTDLLKESPFNLNFKIAADYNSFFSFYKSDNTMFYQVPIIISNYNYEDGFSIKNEIKCIKESYQINRSYNTFSTTLKFIKDYCKVWLKRQLPGHIISEMKKKRIHLYFKEIDV